MSISKYYMLTGSQSTLNGLVLFRKFKVIGSNNLTPNLVLLDFNSEKYDYISDRSPKK